jgi:NAD(P)-dependent dehydrogenase (short-subunit alcohol dehydrogenase family)
MGMLYAWDVELQRFGIRTNALWPVAETDMTQVVMDGARQRAEASGRDAPTAKQIGFGAPAEVATAVVYLCSERAAHLRSQLVTFNGSKLALWQHPRETQVHRQQSWTVDQIAAVLHDAAEPVYVPEF